MKPFYDASGSWINEKRVIGLLSLEAGLILKNHRVSGSGMGAGHKVRHAIFGQFLPPPLPLSHFVTHPGTPPKVRRTSRIPPIFSRPSTKIPDKSTMYKFYLNCSRRFCPGGFVWVGFCT